jgi:hypothetical protein
MVWLTQLRVDSSYAAMILPAFLIMAAGMAFVFVPLGNTSLTGVANHDAGVASALLNTTQQIGGSLGVALLNTVFTTAVASFITAHGPAQAVQGAIHGYNVAFTVSAILLGLSTLVTFVMIRKDPENSVEIEHADVTSAAPAPVHVG